MTKTIEDETEGARLARACRLAAQGARYDRNRFRARFAGARFRSRGDRSTPPALEARKRLGTLDLTTGGE